jgi:ribulose-bisphosphate carboxylase large chain
VEITYRFTQVEGSVERFAEEVLLEQTFETPQEVVDRYPHLRSRRGRVIGIEKTAEGHLARLQVPDDVASESPAQFLNVLFGNASLHPGIELNDFDPSPAILDMLGGPAFGVEGIRARLGVHDRPLTCSAIKPVGLSLEELVTLCEDFAAGGIDIIKDDHYLDDRPEARFTDRVNQCSEVVREIGARQGREVWYVPNITGTPDSILRSIEIAHSTGVGAIMLSPYLMGLPAFHALVHEVDVPVLAHPTFSGSHAISPGIRWGLLPRLFGADATIFASAGGRFGISTDDCRLIAASAAAPVGNVRRSFPVPAGGMDAATAHEVIRFYGNDVVLLVGGSLLKSDDLRAATEVFVDHVHRAALLTG